jgi:hypothetical protein
LRTIGGGGIVVMAILLSYEWPWRQIGWKHYHSGAEFDTLGNVTDLIVLAVLFAAAMVMLGRTVRGSDKLCAVLGVAPLIALLGYVMSAGSEDPLLSMLLYNGYVLVLGVGVTLIGIQSERLGTLNFGLAVLAAWIAARFFDSDIDFVVRGLVFIVLGIGFLAANLTMLRRRRKQA